MALYVCRPSPSFAMTSLTQYALSRGRIVIACRADVENPLRVPPRRRPEWCEGVVPLLESGAVQGLVVPSERELADSEAERRCLRGWLEGLGVDLDYMCRQHPAITP